MNTIDLIVVGAGPAGLMTAKTAAELGLSVTVIELKNDISKITRACSAQFVLDKGYENESLKIEKGKIVFTENNFTVPYTGSLIYILNNYYHSPKDHKIHLAHKDQRPFAVKFDKEQLIKDLWECCQKAGVTFLTGTIAYGGLDEKDYVRVDIKNKSGSSSLKCSKLVIAEGANANLTGKFGLNKGRKLYGAPLVVSYTLRNAQGFEPQSWNQFCGRIYHPFAEIAVGPAITDINDIEITVTGNKQFPPDMIFEKFLKNGAMKEQLASAAILGRKGCSLKSYQSLKKPYSGNVLAIGDSAAHVEVIVQGALMCGYHAANAVSDEINNKDGFEKYTDWWDKSFDFNRTDPEKFITLYGTLSFGPQYTDDELDYLFSLVENERLQGNFSQFEVPKTVWKAILSHRHKIQAEHPELFYKIRKINDLNLKGML